MMHWSCLERAQRWEGVSPRRNWSLSTRRKGLDRETNKALLLKHIQESEGPGAFMREFEEVLPALSRRQIKVLIQELRNEGKIAPIRTGFRRFESFDRGRKERHNFRGAP